MDLCGIFDDSWWTSMIISASLVIILLCVCWFLYAKSNFQTVFFTELFRGLTLTQKVAQRPKDTIQYPEEKLPRSNRFRGLLALRRYPNGEERCIGCKLCEVTCPALAITIETKPRDDGTRRTTRFDIDMFKCINCGLCEQACPVDSIVSTPEEHYVVTQRGQNIMTKDKLLALGDAVEPRLAHDRQLIHEGDG